MSAPGPFQFSIPVRGGELRLLRSGPQVALEMWGVHPGDRALMRGGFVLDAQDLRVLLHGLKHVIWGLDREEAT